MKTRIFLLLVAATALLGATSCKTTEKNYKSAYDIAKAKNMERNKLNDDEVFDKIEKEKSAPTATINGEKVRMDSRFVSVVEDDPSVAKKYNVVAKDFKQVFNARSLRDRLKEQGHPSYLLYEASDKNYYVVVQGFDEASQAMDFILNRDKLFKMTTLELYIVEKIH